jgi:hypothetical protein
VLRRRNKQKRKDEVRSAFEAVPAFGRGLRGWCAVAGGVTLEAVVTLWGLKPPPSETLASLGDELDRYMRSPAFLQAMRRGVGLLNAPAYVMTSQVMRARELARKGVLR